MGGRGAALRAGKPREAARPQQPAEHIATTSTGLEVSATAHLLDRSAERTIQRSDIEDALENPLHVCEVTIDKFGRESVRYIGQYATVAVNPINGNATTVWQTGKRLLRKYKPREEG